jgi:hypothetical protein
MLKVISGGQTGADIAGLIAAKRCGLVTGGTAPSGFKTEFGPNFDLRDVYGLIDKGSYKSRTIQNVKDSDSTIAFIVHLGRGGTSKTIGYCKYGKWVDYYKTDNLGIKPVLVIDALGMALENLDKTVIEIRDWIENSNIKTVNIAGHRQSTSFQKPFYSQAPYDYQERVVDILVKVFDNLYV